MIEVVESNRLFGIAKDMNKELEKLPLVSHATLVALLNSLLQHRQINEDLLANEAKKAVADRQMAMMEAEQKRQADVRDAQARAREAEQLTKPTPDHSPRIELATR